VVIASCGLHRVAATGATYFRRFYLRKSLCEYDPRLVGPACLYLACKTEESQVPAKVLYHFMRRMSSAPGEPFAPSWGLLATDTILACRLFLRGHVRMRRPLPRHACA
jgi:hypothetical protein